MHCCNNQLFTNYYNFYSINIYVKLFIWKQKNNFKILSKAAQNNFTKKRDQQNAIYDLNQKKLLNQPITIKQN
jgi:hypothetical protein